MEVHRISPRIARQRIERGEPVQFVDARRPTDWLASGEQLLGAVRLPNDRLAEFLAGLAHEPPIVVYGEHDLAEELCELTARLLVTAGFPHVFVLDGGLDRWIAEGHPTEPKDGAAYAPTA